MKDAIWYLIIFLVGIFVGKFYFGTVEKVTSVEYVQVEQPFDLAAHSALFYGAFVECSICPEDEVKEVVKVILNRVDDKRFPNTIDAVLTERGQFDAVNKWDFKKWNRMAQWVHDAMNEQRDTTVLGYFRPDTATDLHWVKKMQPRVKVVHHYHKFHTM